MCTLSTHPEDVMCGIYPLTSLHGGASNHYNVVQRDLVSGMRPPETTWTHLRPCGDLWSGVWASSRVYVYPIYVAQVQMGSPRRVPPERVSGTMRGIPPGKGCREVWIPRYVGHTMDI